MEKSIVDQDKFDEHHKKQVHHRSQKDIFFIWLLLIFISVITAHFVLNFLGVSPTGYVTAAQSTADNTILLLGSMFVVFIVILIVGLVHVGVSQRDY